MENWNKQIQKRLESLSLNYRGQRMYIGGGGTSVQQVDPYQGTGVRGLYKTLTDWLGQGIQGGPTAYPGTITPGISPLQQMGFGAAQGLGPLATGGQQYFQNVLGMTDPAAAQGYMGMAGQGLQNLMQPFDPTMAMQAMQPARQFATDIFQQDIIPSIMERLPMSGAKASGSMERALGREGARLAGGLGAELGRYIFPAWQNQLGRQQAGIGQAMGLAQLPGQLLGQAGQIGGMGTDMLSQLMNIGGIQRGITGQQMMEPFQKWQYQQPWNYLSMGLGQPPMENIGMQQGPGFGAQMMPGIGSFLGTERGSGMLGNLLSKIPIIGGLFG